MRVLATFLLMVSLLAMSVTVAGADIARPACSSQIRADNMCYAVSLSGAKAETVKKPGTCLVCLVPTESADDPLPPASRLRATFDGAVLPDTRWTMPWRPPRA